MKSISSKAFFILGLSLINLAYSCKNNKKETAMPAEKDSKLYVEILDAEANSIIDSTSQIEVIATGFDWAEGPLWIEDGQYLIFSDVPRNKIYKVTKEHDTLTYLEPSGFTGTDFKGSEPGSNGLTLNAEGMLVMAQHGNRDIAEMNAPVNDPKPDFKVLTADFEGKKFNSPNDLVYDNAGNLYFTDPPYGLPGGENDTINKQLDFQGVYCLLKSGELKLIDTLSRPNGVTLSPDNSKLYVSNSDPDHAVWYQYELSEPGTVADKSVFYDVTSHVGKPDEAGLPDGMKMQKDGYLFGSGPGGIWIFNPQGKPMARIRTDRPTANCAFTTDQKTLYMTADDRILSVNLK
ncbi:SMP-30/gluconolactonase/LRE family protein [Gaetbulibacter aestuarii]|uniref:SMP-30/gluconolactonase/LRE family protein n=1 Tax=Gaetbulibacter aestuarii TaxID=1502358 RepID=A0ABW7N090_9FLAO